MTRVDPSVPIRSYSMIWQRTDDGWARHMIREQKSRPLHKTTLHSVLPDLPTCMACLSTKVNIIPSEKYPDGELLCSECGVQYGFTV